MNLALGFSEDGTIEQYFCHGYNKIECEEALPDAMRIMIISCQSISFHYDEYRPEVMQDWQTRKYYESVGNEWEVTQYILGNK